MSLWQPWAAPSGTFRQGGGADARWHRRTGKAGARPGWAALGGRAGLGRHEPGRDGLSWGGLRWAGPGLAGLSWAGLGWSGPPWHGLSWAGLGWAVGILPSARGQTWGAAAEAAGREACGMVTRVTMPRQCNTLCFVSLGRRCHRPSFCVCKCSSLWVMGEIMGIGYSHHPFTCPNSLFLW